MDRDKTRAFLDRIATTAAEAATLGVLAVADRCGLLRAMGAGVGGDAATIAAETGLDPRYVEEILAGLYASGVVDYEEGVFSLPPEHAAVIADDTSPYSMTGWLDMIPTALEHTDAIAAASRNGGGVAFDAFGDTMIRGLDRANRPSLTILLTRRWLASMPDIVARLAAGGSIADVGCGSGAAVAAMAKSFPRCRVVGYDTSRSSIERARTSTSAPNALFVAGSTDHMANDGPFDLVTMIDVVHDLPKPAATLAEVKANLADDGVIFIVEPRVPDRFEDRTDTTSRLNYGISLFHCMTQSLAIGGDGLGAGLGTSGIRELCAEAGLSEVSILPIENPFSAFYRVS